MLAFHGFVLNNTDDAITAKIDFKMVFLVSCIPTHFIPIYSKYSTIKFKDEAKTVLEPIINKFKFTWKPNVGILYFKNKLPDDTDWKTITHPMKYEPFGDITKLVSYIADNLRDIHNDEIDFNVEVADDDD